jgi:hypothetical protein
LRSSISLLKPLITGSKHLHPHACRPRACAELQSSHPLATSIQIHRNPTQRIIFHHSCRILHPLSLSLFPDRGTRDYAYRCVLQWDIQTQLLAHVVQSRSHCHRDHTRIRQHLQRMHLIIPRFFIRQLAHPLSVVSECLQSGVTTSTYIKMKGVYGGFIIAERLVREMKSPALLH